MKDNLKIRYDRNQLLQLRNTPNSKKIPDNLLHKLGIFRQDLSSCKPCVMAYKRPSDDDNPPASGLIIGG